MKSTWKGAIYLTPGILPLGGGLIWSAQVGLSVLMRTHSNRGTPKNTAYRTWKAVKTRPYYLTSPWGNFTVTSRGGLQKLKWKNKK